MNKKFKGRCIIHPGIFVGVTNFDSPFDDETKPETIGYGVFTDQDIPAGTILEECISAKERIPRDSKVMTTYRFPSPELDNKGETGWRILLGMTSLCNHSDDFNATVIVSDEFMRLTTLAAHKDIKAGEEIFINYNSVSNKGDK